MLILDMVVFVITLLSLFIINFTPLLSAVCSSKYEICEILINHGAEIDVSGGVSKHVIIYI